MAVFLWAVVCLCAVRILIRANTLLVIRGQQLICEDGHATNGRESGVCCCSERTERSDRNKLRRLIIIYCIKMFCLARGKNKIRGYWWSGDAPECMRAVPEDLRIYSESS